MNTKLLLSLCSLLLLVSEALGQPNPVGVFAEVSQTSVTEGTSFTITVRANAGQTFDYTVRVAFDLYDAPGHPGINDLSGAIVGTVTMRANQLSAPPLTLTALTDGMYEGNETFEFRINADSQIFPAYRPIAPTNVFVTILDADAVPQVYFNTTTTTVMEDNVTVPISVLLSPRSQAEVRVNWAIASLPLTTATYPADFNMVLGGQNGTLVFPSGVGTTALDLRVTEDPTDELDERVVLNLSNPIGATLRTGFSTNAITILDDDLPPTVSFETAAASALESAGTRTINVRLSAASGQTVTVNWSITGGTATAGSDFTGATAGTLTFIPVQTLATISLPVVNDATEEPDETVVFSLSAPSNATLAAPTTHTATIIDDDVSISWGPMQINAFGQRQTNVAESIGTVLVPVRLSRALSLPVSVNVKDTNRTTSATAGVDYVLNNTSVLISPPATEGFVSITILNDTLNEFDELLDLDLRSPNLGQVTGPATARVVIVDDDSRPTLQFFRSTATDYETNGLMYVDLVLSAPSDIGASVDFVVGGTAVEGRDYTILNGTHHISFNPGETSATIYLSYVNNAIYDGNRTIQFTLLPGPFFAVLGARTVHTLTVIDNDLPPTASFANTSTSFGEATTSPTIPVVLSAPAGTRVKVNVAVAGGTATGGGVDYSLNSGTVYFEAGETTKNVNLTCVNDVLDEPNETIGLALSPGTFTFPSDGYTGIGVAGIASRTFEIADDDTPPQVGFGFNNFTMSEGVITATGTDVLLDRPSGLTVTVQIWITGGTASNGVDYTISPLSLSFAPGETSKALVVYFIEDTLAEGDESITLALANPIAATFGANATQTLWILEDDALTAAPEHPLGLGVNPGHNIHFRKASASFVVSDVNAAELLMKTNFSSGIVAFDLWDAVQVINYVDAATTTPPVGYVPNDMDFHSTPPGSPNGFATGDINDFAFNSTGYLHVPTPGTWAFTVRSDDGFRLRIGSNNLVVGEFVAPRAPGDSVVPVNFPQAGYYRYSLIYCERGGGAEIEFLVRPPQTGGVGLLVGDPNSPMRVFTSLEIPPIVQPEPSPILGAAGHAVEFRKTSFGVANINSAYILFDLGTNDAQVLAVASDNGVAVINYSDDTADGVFTTGNRLVATPPMTALKGSFLVGAEDNFGMRSSGLLYIPTPGVWNFCVNSDDGFELRMGTNLLQISAFTTVRGAATTTNRVQIPSAGYYPYQLLYWEYGGGAEVEFFAFGPGQAAAKLVGDPNGLIQVRQPGTPRPRLEILRAGSQVVLRWPAVATGWTPEYASAVASPGSWFNLGGTPAVNGTNWVLTDNVLPNTGRYYRLRKL